MTAAGPGWRSRAFADVGSHWCDLTEFVPGQRIAGSLRGQARSPSDGASETGTKRCPVDTEDAVSLSFVTDGGVLGNAVICQVAAGRKNRLYLELSGTDTSFAFNQEEPELLWVGRQDGSKVLQRDLATLSEDVFRTARRPCPGLGGVLRQLRRRHLPGTPGTE